MADLDITLKRYNGNTYDVLHPTTVISQVTNLQDALDAKIATTQKGVANGVATLDANVKIPLAQLPDAVFDSLMFYGTVLPGTTTGAKQGQATVISEMIAAANNADRSPVGYYLVASAAGAIEPFAGQITLGEPETAKYVTLTLQGGDNGSTSTTTTGTMEAGDWIVITSFSGSGTSGSPYIVSATVINNVYETATTGVYGTARLSDATNVQAYNGSTNTGGLVDGSNDVITENFLFDNIIGDGSELTSNTNLKKLAPAAHKHDTLYLGISSTAAAATKLAEARTIAAGGTGSDATWSVSFDGSANVTAALTLASTGVTAGTYKSVTVDAKGRVTSGTNPTTLAGFGITDAYTDTEVDTLISASITDRPKIYYDTEPTSPGNGDFWFDRD